MKNGNVREFVDHIHYGDELFFLYDHKKYFLQGFIRNGNATLFLDVLEPPGEDYLWVGESTKESYPVDKFLLAPLWNGKSFWLAESEMEWVDC